MEAQNVTSGSVIVELNAKLSKLIAQRDAEVVRISALPAVQKATKTTYRVITKDVKLVKDAEVIVNMATLLKPSIVKAAVDSGLIEKVAPVKSAVDNTVYAEFNRLTTEIKAIAKEIQSVALSNTLKKSGSRSASARNGELARPAGYYKVTDQIRKDMKVSNERKVGKDIVCDYVNGKGEKCSSKLVNAAIAWHKIHDKKEVKAIPVKI